MASLTANQFEKRFGAMARAEYPDLNYKALATALAGRQPPIVVSPGALRQWINRRQQPADGITVSSTDELQEKYAELVQRLSAEHPTAYKLCAALRSQTPPIHCSDGIAKVWLKKYGTELR